MAAAIQRVAQRALAVAQRGALARQAGAAVAVQLQQERGSASSAQEQLGSHMAEGKVMHESLLNANILNTQYAVRGELYLKAEELRRAGKQIIFTNVGNPHALGQPPLTFNRQVMALCTAPFLMDTPEISAMFPADVIARAKKILTMIPGGVGAYSDSRGALGIRQEVAQFIAKRDGTPVEEINPDHIFLTDGASVAVRSCLNALIRGKSDGILVPVPQYPLYSASIALYGGTMVPYSLDEGKNWGLDMESLRSAVAKARSEGIMVRGMVFINPGNPTGQCLSQENLEELAKFAHEEKVVLMADEVYQENIYQDERPFVSMRKTISEMGEPYRSEIELLFFHTVSKGTVGECGLRGGYVEMKNISQGAVDQIYKVASVNLSPNVVGQVSMSLMMNPPQPGEESYEQFTEEKAEILASLRRRAHIMTDAFNSLEDVTCNFTEGAMYSFPQIRLPAKAIAAAEALGKQPDVFYCLRLLEETGISTVPGSGFGQEPGTYHMRTTILPNESMMPEIVERLQKFHAAFMAEYK